MPVNIPDIPGYLQANPLEPLFSDALLIQHEQMIAATLNNCAVPCLLTFGDSLWIDCTNCNEGLYGPGGTQISDCRACNGTKQVSVDESVELCLAVEWESSKFQKFAGVDLAEVSAQIMTFIEWCPLLMGAKKIQLDTCNKCHSEKYFKVSGPPYPCGFGRRKAFAVVNLESI